MVIARGYTFGTEQTENRNLSSSHWNITTKWTKKEEKHLTINFQYIWKWMFASIASLIAWVMALEWKSLVLYIVGQKSRKKTNSNVHNDIWISSDV